MGVPQHAGHRATQRQIGGADAIPVFGIGRNQIVARIVLNHCRHLFALRSIDAPRRCAPGLCGEFAHGASGSATNRRGAVLATHPRLRTASGRLKRL